MSRARRPHPVLAARGEIDVATSPRLRTELAEPHRARRARHHLRSSTACPSSTRRASACSSAPTSACVKNGDGSHPHRRRAAVGAQGVRDHRPRARAAHRLTSRACRSSSLTAALPSPFWLRAALGHLLLVLGHLGVERQLLGTLLLFRAWARGLRRAVGLRVVAFGGAGLGSSVASAGRLMTAPPSLNGLAFVLPDRSARSTVVRVAPFARRDASGRTTSPDPRSRRIT